MLSLLLPISALLAGVALLLLGNGLLGTLLPLRGTLAGFSDQTLGFMGSAYFAGFFIGTYIAPPLIRGIGHIRAFAFFAALAACTVLLHPLEITPLLWISLRIGSGVALVALYMIIESWLNSHAPREHRGKIFAVYMVVNLAALAAAQQLLQLAALESFTLFALAAILFCGALLPITVTQLPQPSLARAHPYTPLRLWRIAPVAATAALLSGLAMGPFWGLAPVYAGRVGLDPQGVALFMSLSILGGALFQWPIGLLSDRGDRRRTIALVTLGATAAAALLTIAGLAGAGVLVASLIYGGLAFAVYPVAVALLMDHLQASESLAGGSGLMLIHGLGAATGPALAGLLMTHLGAAGLPLFFGAIQGALGVYTYLETRRRQDDVSQPSHFMPMVRTSPTVLAMMPDEDTPPRGPSSAQSTIPPETPGAPPQEEGFPRPE